MLFCVNCTCQQCQQIFKFEIEYKSYWYIQKYIIIIKNVKFTITAKRVSFSDENCNLLFKNKCSTTSCLMLSINRMECLPIFWLVILSCHSIILDVYLLSLSLVMCPVHCHFNSVALVVREKRWSSVTLFFPVLLLRLKICKCNQSNTACQ